MPDHPVLRQVAEEMERFDRVAQIVDRAWKFVYISSGMWRAANDGVVIPEMYGMGHIRREIELKFAPNTPESGRTWWRMTAPYMRYTLEPGTPEFEDAFASTAPRAAEVEPKPPPPVWGFESSFNPDALPGGAVQHLVSFRLDDYDGQFIGVLDVSWPAVSGIVTQFLAHGDAAMYERMAALRTPHRCRAALLFCDIEASGELSRRLSSRAYFELIRSVTSAIDEAVASRGGIVGKHAGDGASAFFNVADFGGSESDASRAAIEAAREVRGALATVEVAGRPIAINCGLHWGGTIVMGQVADRGRLEITALGDEVNEAARIEAVARAGISLASKDLLERLEPDDAAELGIDPEGIAYRTVAELEGSSGKAVRDAGTIPVAEV